MKAEMNSQGQIVLTPESWAEAHALNAWKEGNKVYGKDLMRQESFKYREQAIVVVPQPPR